MSLLHFYKKPGISDYHKEKLLKENKASIGITEICTELCFNVETLNNEPLSVAEIQNLSWLLAETFEQENFSTQTFLKEVLQLLQLFIMSQFFLIISLSINIAHALTQLERERSYHRSWSTPKFYHSLVNKCSNHLQ